MQILITVVKFLSAKIVGGWKHLNDGHIDGWDRNYLCSMAPLSADALRIYEEARPENRHW